MTVEPAYHYAALLDVLGYRHYLERDRACGTLEFQSQLSEALSVFDKVSDTDFNVRAISDTIIVTCLKHDHFPELLEILRDVFIAFMQQELFIRGGIAYSRHFQSGRLTYSHAIARAYELETKSAVYPRIVVDKNIIDMYKVGKGLPDITNIDSLCQENGVYFLNVLKNDNWQEIYDCAKRIYENSSDALRGDEHTLIKHLRFERYLLNSSCAPKSAVNFIDEIIPV